MTTKALTVRAPKNRLALPLAIRLSAEEIARTESYAANEVRSRSSFIRLMFLRGLQQYEIELASNQ